MPTCVSSATTSTPSVRPLVVMSALRPHQWVKNLMLFVPVSMAHELGNLERVLDVLLAFVAYSLCASAVYVTNDLFDLEVDRTHPTKRNRPFASGALRPAAGVAMIPALVLPGLWLGYTVSITFLAGLCAYLAVTTAYSLKLKQLLLVDVLTLAGLYTWRIYCGGMAAEVPISAWLLAFSVFVFLSLALVKRSSELVLMERSGEEGSAGRGYLVEDSRATQALGAAAGYSALVVFALYINGEHVRSLYTNPEVLWLMCPLLLYWVSRLWLLAGRGRIDADPVVFTLKDPASYVVAALALPVFLWAKGGL